jgi:hypothetical protein
MYNSRLRTALLVAMVMEAPAGSAIFLAEVPRIVRAFLCHNGVANFPHSVTRATGVFSQQACA